ncbi:MAG: DUF4384 domain-containing protein [Bacteroidetes bacterium]|nr:DUF4384 domain-containing protein [Bacteroidota bacterium]
MMIAIFSAVVTIQSVLAEQKEAMELFYNPVKLSASKALFGNNSSQTVISPDTAPGVELSPENIGGLGGIGGYYEKLENQGVSAWIELQRKGSNSVKRVEPSRVFKSGDKIRVHITTNGEGYLHALHKGSSGVERMIPISDSGRVSTGQAVVIPSNGGWLKFDKHVGIEKIDLLYGSTSQAAESGFVPISTSTQASLTANVRDVVNNYMASKSLVTFEQKGTKDLLVVDQTTGGTNSNAISLGRVPINRDASNQIQISQNVYSAPAQYAVNTTAEPVVMRLNLKHQ